MPKLYKPVCELCNDEDGEDFLPTNSKSRRSESQLGTAVGIIGIGKIGSIIAARLNKAGYRVIGSRRKAFEANHETTTDNSHLAKNSDVIVLTVKQKDLSEVAEQINSHVGDKLVLSLLAGVTLSTLDKILKSRNVRVMTNIAFEYGSAISGYSLGEKCTEKDRQAVEEILKTGGSCLKLKEGQMNSFTALSSCALGFYAKISEYLSKVSDFEADETRKILGWALTGVGKLALSGRGFNELASAVASKGGMTEAGLRVMEEHRLGETLNTVMTAAYSRGKELNEMINTPEEEKSNG